MEKNKKVYIDVNIFIYATLNTNLKGEKSRVFLQKIKNNIIDGFTSILTFDEFFWRVKKERSFDEAVKASEAFLNFPNLKFIDATNEITLRALDLIKKYKLDPRDSIHAASALSKNISTIISDDLDFSKIKELKRKSLSQI